MSLIIFNIEPPTSLLTSSPTIAVLLDPSKATTSSPSLESIEAEAEFEFATVLDGNYSL